MPARHRSRERALQVLFQCDVRQIGADEAIGGYYETLRTEDENAAAAGSDEFMESLVRGTLSKQAALDEQITTKSTNWRLDRMPAVDRNILRLALYEMELAESPRAVIIDEALELARQFSGDDSVSFINAVLDAGRKDPQE